MHCDTNTTAPHALPLEEGAEPAAKASTGAEAAGSNAAPQGSSALLLVSISPDRIRMTASLVMGRGTQTIARSWHRSGRGTWGSNSEDFVLSEERLGLEFAEWLDSIDLPGRVANMLPRPATEAGAALAAQVAKEVHGA